jgi:hypothetical protein
MAARHMAQPADFVDDRFIEEVERSGVIQQVGAGES